MPNSVGERQAGRVTAVRGSVVEVAFSRSASRFPPRSRSCPRISPIFSQWERPDFRDFIATSRRPNFSPVLSMSMLSSASI